MQLQVTDTTVTRAGALAWDYHLGGYGAVHLASAMLWQESLKQPVTMAVFDQNLWTVAEQVGLTPFPADLGAFMG